MISLDASKASSIYGSSSTVQPESHEWMICVVVAGQATNLGSVDVGNVMSAVAQVQSEVSSIPKPNAYVTETWRSGSNWYRKWSDGFIEQGGVTSSTAGQTARTVQLNTAFSSNGYVVTVQSYTGGSGELQYNSFQVTAKAVSNFKTRAQCTERIIALWYACGY